jgi:hypothetical protein
VSLFATEKLPSPMVMIGIVSIDNWRRNLVVARPDTLGGYEKLSWRTAHEALVKAELSTTVESGADVTVEIEATGSSVLSLPGSGF